VDEQRFEQDYTRDVAGRRRLFSAVIAERRGRPELAAADVLDLSAIFDARADPVYIDAYHLSESGNIAVAEAMLPALVSAVVACRGTA
jgi:hypothetical protein